MSNTISTVTDLRSVLYEQIELVQSGKADLRAVNAITNAARQALNSVRLQVEAARMTGKSQLLKGCAGLLPEAQ